MEILSALNFGRQALAPSVHRKSVAREGAPRNGCVYNTFERVLGACSLNDICELAQVTDVTDHGPHTDTALGETVEQAMR